MPRINGFEMSQKIKQMQKFWARGIARKSQNGKVKAFKKPIPVVAITADRDINDNKDYLKKIGVRQVYQKPMFMPTLLEILRKYFF